MSRRTWVMDNQNYNFPQKMRWAKEERQYSPYVCVCASTKKDYNGREEIPLGINLSSKMGLVFEGNSYKNNHMDWVNKARSCLWAIHNPNSCPRSSCDLKCKSECVPLQKDSLLHPQTSRLSYRRWWIEPSVGPEKKFNLIFPEAASCHPHIIYPLSWNNSAFKWKKVQKCRGCPVA